MLRVMNEDLSIFSYTIQTAQKLTLADKKERLELVQVLTDKIELKSFPLISGLVTKLIFTLMTKLMPRTSFGEPLPQMSFVKGLYIHQRSHFGVQCRPEGLSGQCF